jgi:hypothetical protein
MQELASSFKTKREMQLVGWQFCYNTACRGIYSGGRCHAPLELWKSPAGQYVLLNVNFDGDNAIPHTQTCPDGKGFRGRGK